jgi:hypothetical protein
MTSQCTPEYNAKTRDMMDQLEKLKATARKLAKPEVQNKTRLTQLGKQEESLKAKVDAGHAEKSPPREKPVYNEAVFKQQAKVNELKRQIDALVQRGERLNRSPAMKVTGTILDTQRAAILATLHVFKKLGYAVGGGHLSSILADATRSGVRHIIPSVAAQAPRYGKGLNFDALKERARGLKEAPVTALQQLTEGHASREAGYIPSSDYLQGMDHITKMFKDAANAPGALNKIAETARATASAVGRTHAAEKEFLTQPEYRESLARRFDHANDMLEKEGVPLDKRQEILGRESTHMAINAKAVADAYDAKMQGKNALNQGVNLWLSRLEKSNNTAYQMAAAVFRFFEPIRNIGVNIAVHYSGHAVGALKAAGSAIRWRNGMTEEHAEYIMKNAGQQGAGIALMAAGALFYNQLGGIPGVFSKKDQPKEKDATGNDIQPGEGIGVGTEAFHGAGMAQMQVGASMMQIFEKEYGKEKGAQLAFDVWAKPNWAWFTRNLWFADTVRRTYNTVAYGRGAKARGPEVFGEVAGNQLRSLIPAQLQAVARDEDPRKGYPKPRNIKEDIESGIPGLRKNVPVR